VAAVNGDPAVEFLVSGGDLVDTGSATEEWDRTMSALAALRVPLYGINGNHELNGGDGEEHHARFGRMNASFAYGGVRFVLVDSGSGTLADRVWSFVDGELADESSMSVFVTHIPPLDPDPVRQGGLSSVHEGEALLAMLARRGVDLALYGHLHTFVATHQAGIPTWVSGGGAVSNTRLDDLGRHILFVELDPADGAVSVTRRDL
jgi:DNA repair exonuclease SbcCD nuclease subunit